MAAKSSRASRLLSRDPTSDLSQSIDKSQIPNLSSVASDMGIGEDAILRVRSKLQQRRPGITADTDELDQAFPDQPVGPEASFLQKSDKVA